LLGLENRYFDICAIRERSFILILEEGIGRASYRE